MSKRTNAIISIGDKPIIERLAIATGRLTMSSKSKTAIISKQIQKGDVLEASTIAAIQASKDTPRAIPHCHPIPLESCTVEWNWEENDLICTVTVSAHWKTGVEMEALNSVSNGLLCVLDMIKSVEKDEFGQYPNTEIHGIRVLKKKKANGHV
ncbi:MAG: cyclic pyranopterin monophosphate synthase MoaC [Candidatus Thermoplasmatota archaeon]|nr:cyclic pyranopterin monophosphate synthase MoaC [Candidatus Thermoplasmatota archaeon]